MSEAKLDQLEGRRTMAHMPAPLPALNPFDPHGLPISGTRGDSGSLIGKGRVPERAAGLPMRAGLELMTKID